MNAGLFHPDGSLGFMLFAVGIALVVYAIGRWSGRRSLARARADLDASATVIVSDTLGGFRTTARPQVGLGRVIPLRPESERLPKDAA